MLALFLNTHALDINFVHAFNQNSWRSLLISIALHALIIVLFAAEDSPLAAHAKDRHAVSLNAVLRSPVTVSDAWGQPGSLSAKQPAQATADDPKQTALVRPLGETPLLSIPVPSVPQYIKSNELDVKPRVIVDIPTNLGQALHLRNSGFATLRLRINEYGYIDEILLDESDLSEEDQHQIITAFRKTRFSAGKLGIEAVKSEMRIRVAIEAIRHIELENE